MYPIALLMFAALSARADLAVMSLTTADGRDPSSRDVSVDARLDIDPRGGDPAWALTAPVRLRGRGNSTWNMAKKPYRLHFTTAHGPFGWPADRDWSLLANYADKSLLRNSLAFHLSRTLGLAFTPRDRAVRLILNGRERGVYQLVEEIKVAPHRLNLGTDGVLLEIDRWMSDTAFVTERDVPYSIAHPRDADQALRARTKDFVVRAERALHAPYFADPNTGYARYVDADSFVDWYLVNEIMKNTDAGNWSSIYLHREGDGPLKMGPAWDFDLAAGNVDFTAATTPEGWWIRTENPWFKRLFDDPNFTARVRARWADLGRLQLDEAQLLAFVDQRAAQLAGARAINFEVWDILTAYVWPNAEVTGSYDGEIAYLKSWLSRRLRWLTAHLGPQARSKINTSAAPAAFRFKSSRSTAAPSPAVSSSSPKCTDPRVTCTQYPRPGRAGR